MEKFEIHITGTPIIIDVLKELKIKSLHAEMRNPQNKTVGIEYMSSFIKEFENYESCKKWVDKFSNELENRGVSPATISRIERGNECDFGNVKALDDWYSSNGA